MNDFPLQLFLDSIERRSLANLFGYGRRAKEYIALRLLGEAAEKYCNEQFGLRWLAFCPVPAGHPVQWYFLSKHSEDHDALRMPEVEPPPEADVFVKEMEDSADKDLTHLVSNLRSWREWRRLRDCAVLRAWEVGSSLEEDIRSHVSGHVIAAFSAEEPHAYIDVKATVSDCCNALAEGLRLVDSLAARPEMAPVFLKFLFTQSRVPAAHPKWAMPPPVATVPKAHEVAEEVDNLWLARNRARLEREFETRVIAWLSNHDPNANVTPHIRIGTTFEDPPKCPPLQQYFMGCAELKGSGVIFKNDILCCLHIVRRASDLRDGIMHIVTHGHKHKVRFVLFALPAHLVPRADEILGDKILTTDVGVLELAP